MNRHSEIMDLLIKSEYQEIFKIINDQDKTIEQYKNGGSQALFNVSKSNKKKFKIGLRREFPKFAGTSQFIRWCIREASGMSFNLICEKGE